MEILIVSKDQTETIASVISEISNATAMIENRLSLVLKATENNTDLKYVIMPADLAFRLITDFFKR